MKLTIPDVPASLNKTLRLHWAVNHKINDTWRWLVREQITPTQKRHGLKMRAKITLCHARPYDKDNAYGAVKPLVDALKYWNILMDDTEEWLLLTVEQEKCPHKQRHTIIELEAA